MSLKQFKLIWTRKDFINKKGLKIGLKQIKPSFTLFILVKSWSYLIIQSYNDEGTFC